MPVNAIIPDVIEEKTDSATGTLTVDAKAGSNLFSILGRISPAKKAVTAYKKGIAHSGSGERRFLVNMAIMFEH
jgi:hypothetical protein